MGPQVVSVAGTGQRLILPRPLQPSSVSIEPEEMSDSFREQRWYIPRFEFPDVAEVLRRGRGQIKKLSESQKVRIPTSVLEGVDDQVLGFGQLAEFFGLNCGGSYRLIDEDWVEIRYKIYVDRMSFVCAYRACPPPKTSSQTRSGSHSE